MTSWCTRHEMQLCGPRGALLLLVVCAVAVAGVTSAKVGGTGGWDNAPNTQYHIQTDEGPERYFRYQTISGQYRKEKRLQDGTVVGTYGWVDPNGFLRLRDYVADNTGYRVVRTKMLFVGKDDPIADAVAKSKGVPSQGGTGVNSLPAVSSTPAPPTPSAPSTTSAPAYVAPISAYPYAQPDITSNALPPADTYTNPYVLSNTAAQYPLVPATRRTYDVGAYQQQNYAAASSNVQSYQQPLYDGIAATHNGFRYFLPRQYHEEEGTDDRRAGSFGYIDPFGIRRVIYYNTAPGTGFVHRKNNRYVGFNATPYDPRY
ncbi:cuticle protein 19.8 isoform X1 [Periplaneta americana]|uniref:cuticle protein 19.8 isoform X1 n=1 Tax=Periplaneta americana TaxID=6978 RepID=UPI0037E9B9D7